MARFFIDAENGNDETGDGSRKYPYQSIESIYKQPLQGEVNIYLKYGTYPLHGNFIKSIPANTTIAINGSGLKTILAIADNSSNWDNVGNITSTLIVKRLIFDADKITWYHQDDIMGNYVYYHNYIRAKCKMIFYNVCFNNIRYTYTCWKNDNNIWRPEFWLSITSNKYRYFFSSQYNSIELYNCIYPFEDYYFKREGKTGLGGYITSFDRFIEKSNYPVIVHNSFGALGNVSANWNSNINNYPTNVQTQFLDSSYRFLEKSIIDKGIGIYFGVFPWTFANYLIWMNNKYYSPQDRFYNQDAKMYNEVTLSDINANGLDEYTVSDLFDFSHTLSVLGEEIFYPIDKFDNFKVIVVKPNYLYLNGLKSYNELIVQTFDINPTSVKTINSINITANISDDSNIKFVFSLDTGETWQTYIDGVLTFTDCVIPRKSYEDMNQFEKDSFDAAKETIIEKGMSISDFSNIDFNGLNPQRLRFAFLINRKSFLSTSNIAKVSWNYNDKDYIDEFQKTDGKIEVYENVIKVTSNVDSKRLTINIVI